MCLIFQQGPYLIPLVWILMETTFKKSRREPYLLTSLPTHCPINTPSPPTPTMSPSHHTVGEATGDTNMEGLGAIAHQSTRDDDAVPLGGSFLGAPSVVGAPPTKRRRMRFSYAKKSLHASSNLYLQLDQSLPPPASTPDLIGQIITCPNKKNNNHYQINWIGPSCGLEWPLNLKQHLRCSFPKQQLHADVSSLIASCPRNQKSTSIPPTPVAQPNIPHPTTLDDPPLVVEAPVLETPAPSQRPAAAFAALRTAGSSSGASSHDNSEQFDRQPAPRRLSTRVSRQSSLEENDSDENDTDDEDAYEVDFSQNFWRSRQDLQEMVGGDVLLETDPVGECDDVESCPNNVDQNDYACLLKDCTEFQFDELSFQEAATMQPPPKIYGGESGLRRTVAGSFDTPLGAFRKGGFTEELVRHWTMNSNK